MTHEIDWKNAPEGATHYAAAEGVWYACFYKDDFKQVWVCDDESEQWYAQWPSLAKGRSVIPRPTSMGIPVHPKKLTQAVFDGLPPEYRWAAVDADGYLRLGHGYDATDWQNSRIEREEVASPEPTVSDVFQKIAEKLVGGWAECREKREESTQSVEAELSALRTQAIADAAEIERLKTNEKEGAIDYCRLVDIRDAEMVARIGLGRSLENCLDYLMGKSTLNLAEILKDIKLTMAASKYRLSEVYENFPHGENSDES